MRALAWLPLLVLVLAASAEAAPARVGLDLPPVPPVPPGQERSVEGNLTYTYPQPSANRTNVTLVAVGAPEWLTARLEPSAASVSASEPGGRTTLPVRLTVGARPGTAALLQHTLDLRLEAGANDPLEPAVQTVGIPVRVAFAGALRVEVPNGTVSAAPGQPVDVPFRFVNEGNGPTRVTLTTDSPEGSVLVAPPPDFVVDAGAERTVNVSVLPQAAGRFPLQLHYDSVHAFSEAERGARGDVSVVVEARAQGVPMVGVLAPLALAALARPRR